MVPILIYKDVFKPGYNLKFIVQNYNYICTSLYHVLFEKKKYILLLLGNVLFTCQLALLTTGMYDVLADFLFTCSTNYWDWHI